MLTGATTLVSTVAAAAVTTVAAAAVTTVAAYCAWRKLLFAALNANELELVTELRQGMVPGRSS